MNKLCVRKVIDDWLCAWPAGSHRLVSPGQQETRRWDPLVQPWIPLSISVHPNATVGIWCRSWWTMALSLKFKKKFPKLHRVEKAHRFKQRQGSGRILGVTHTHIHFTSDVMITCIGVAELVNNIIPGRDASTVILCIRWVNICHDLLVCINDKYGMFLLHTVYIHFVWMGLCLYSTTYILYSWMKTSHTLNHSINNTSS